MTEQPAEDTNALIQSQEQPLHTGWLENYGGFYGIPLFQSWRDVWVSLDKMGEIFRVYSDEPTESGTRPTTSFFINRLAFAKHRDDEAIPFSDWPVDVDKRRCFVVATYGSAYYFIAKTEEEKIEWLKKINAAKGIFAPDDETDPGEKDQIFHGGWLNKCGGIGGIQPGRTWHHVWVSLNNSWEMLKIYPDKPPESSKLSLTESNKLTFTSGRFFMNYMLSVEKRSDEDASFSWPDGVDTNRCFVVTALENSFYFIAETEEDKHTWVEKISQGIEKFPDMQPTILEFILHEPPLTDTICTQTDQPLDPEKPLYAGWLEKLGGRLGIPLFQKWRKVWVSLDKMGKMFQVYSDEPTEPGTRPKTSFFINRLAFVKDRDDETISFSDWPVDVDERRCFVVATHGSTYYFIAKTEEEKNKWLMSISTAKTTFVNSQPTAEDEEHSDLDSSVSSED
ncbi:uncharacterized protein [Dysidea avara]|uniref:uncharacterized protein n=1 Tax=Dysidea avara TaxID=196820 RepID=UPI00331EC678